MTISKEVDIPKQVVGKAKIQTDQTLTRAAPREVHCPRRCQHQGQGEDHLHAEHRLLPQALISWK